MAIAALILLALLAGGAEAQMKAVADDSNVDRTNNKFLKREAHIDRRDPVKKSDEAEATSCSQDLAVRWHTEIASSIYASPLITDLYNDGRKDIIIPGFRRQLHVLEGRTGAEDNTFDAQHRSTLHTTPILYDIDLDGVLDIAVATYDGDVQFFKDTGAEAAYRLFIPRLRVHKDWFKGLNPDPNDHSHPDVGADADDSGLGERAAGSARRKLLQQDGDSPASHIEGGQQQQQEERQPLSPKAAGDDGIHAPGEHQPQEQQKKAGEGGAGHGGVEDAHHEADAAAAAAKKVPTTKHAVEDEDDDDDADEDSEEGESPVPVLREDRNGSYINRRRRDFERKATVERSEEISKEAAESFAELFAEEEASKTAKLDPDDWLNEELVELNDEDYDDIFKASRIDDSDEDGDGEDDKDSSPSHHHDARHVKPGHRAQQERPHGFTEDDPAKMDEYEQEQHHDYHDYRANAELWEDDLHRDALHDEQHRGQDLNTYVWVDAHVLANPAIGDIDGDGRDELVVAVSYFFDPGEYSANSDRIHAVVGEDGDPGRYLASGVVVFDLYSRAIRWTQHLDLSTTYTRYKAEVHGAPTLADINNDGLMEVIVGTSMGWVYVLDARSGNALEGWPVQMGDVQGQVAVADVDGDGALEIIAADTRGSVAALHGDGKELWERHLGSAVGAGATVGDVDGDGQLEVVLGTFDGRIHVLDAATGQDKLGFPFRTYGRIATPILITKLSDEKTPGMQLVVTSHDGFLYVVDALTRCADSLDLGEPSFAMVLAEDLANTRRLDLLVATAGGNVYAIRTPAKYQPLKAWPAQTPGLGAAGFAARWNWEGVYATATTRVPRDVRGEAVPVRFTVIDKRPALPGGKKRGPYKVLVTLSGVGAKEMGAGNQPVIGMSDTINKTGTYTLEVPCPRTRTSATIRVEMRDETGAVFVDEFALSFHIHFYRLLKWLAVGPFAFTAVAILAYSGADAIRAELPA